MQRQIYVQVILILKQTNKHKIFYFADIYYIIKNKFILSWGIKDNENEKKFSASAILDFLGSLDTAMEDMDVDTADEIIKQIQRYEMPDNLKELTDQLASAVMNLDIQMEHEIVKKLREEMKTSQRLSARYNKVINIVYHYARLKGF